MKRLKSTSICGSWFVEIFINVQRFGSHYKRASFKVMTILVVFPFSVIVNCFPCTMRWILLSLRANVTDKVASYLLDRIGYIDKKTSISFHHNLLFPPTDPQFLDLPHCSWNDLKSIYSPKSSSLSSYQRLLSILTWNVFVYQSSISSLIRESEDSNLPFVTLLTFIDI